MKKSDLMGRFAFDGAEGIAFWIGDSDTEPITKVMFDELETLKAFIEHNLPGMFGAAAPVQPTSTVDEGDLARVIHRAACGPECTDDAPIRMDYRIARAVAEAIGAGRRVK